jgi:uncharacterized protein (DUF924 family)
MVYHMDISRTKDILDYWFSKGLYTADYDKWFMKSQDYDEEIKEKFGDLLREAEQGKGFGWLHTKDSYVAYIILLDQFSRHIYRGSGDSFKNDNGVMIFVEMGWEMYKEQLEGYEFMFAFMPYMHTENMTYQKKGEVGFIKQKQLYGVTSSPCPRPLTDENHPSYSSRMGWIPEKTNYDKEYAMLKSMEPHVTGHKLVISRFGRFPKRNAALGRETTFQEEQYLNREEVKKRPY